MQKNINNQLYPIITVVGVSLALIVGISWWLGGESNNNLQNTAAVNLATEETLPAPLAPEQLPAYNQDMTNETNKVVVFDTNKGIIEIELYNDLMPITAGNFQKLVEEGFYDGIKFHRVIEGFMVQGGDPNTKTSDVASYGRGGPGYAIPDEHVANEKLSNVRGTLSMANSGPNSGGSQFFINLVDNVNLDFDKPPLSSQHPVFGHIVAGMDVVDSIGMSETNMNDLPVEDIVITKAYLK
jgi:peptidylprolyl isomerase